MSDDCRWNLHPAPALCPLPSHWTVSRVGNPSVRFPVVTGVSNLCSSVLPSAKWLFNTLTGPVTNISKELGDVIFSVVDMLPLPCWAVWPGGGLWEAVIPTALCSRSIPGGLLLLTIGCCPPNLCFIPPSCGRPSYCTGVIQFVFWLGTSWQSFDHHQLIRAWHECWRGFDLFWHRQSYVGPSQRAMQFWSLWILESLELEAISDLRIWFILGSWGSLRSWNEVL